MAIARGRLQPFQHLAGLDIRHVRQQFIVERYVFHLGSHRVATGILERFRCRDLARPAIRNRDKSEPRALAKQCVRMSTLGLDDIDEGRTGPKRSITAA